MRRHTLPTGLLAAVLLAGCVEMEEPAPAPGSETAAVTSSCDPYDPDVPWCNYWNNYWNNNWNNYWNNGWSSNWSYAWDARWNHAYAIAQDAWESAFSDAWASDFDDWNFSTPALKWVDTPGCAHPVMQTGARLSASCSPVVSQVCDVFSSCCTSSWTTTCVQTANLLYDNYAGGSLTHSVSVTGAKLASTHSQCAAAVIAAMPTCGDKSGVTWSLGCVKKAAELCTGRYLARVRIEEERLMVDACIEPALTGAGTCPIDHSSGPTGYECCRRTLVLEGCYRATETTDGHGRIVDWSPTCTITRSDGVVKTLSATLVPDPCDDDDDDGECSEMHHLWQAAGPRMSPDAPELYPDCSGSGGPLPCPPGSTTQVLDSSHSSVAVRGILVAVQSALITTNGHYQIDLRYSTGGGSTLLVPDHAFDGLDVEAVWGFRVGYNAPGGYEGRPICFEAGSPARADPALVDGISPECKPAYYELDNVATRYTP